MLRDGVNMVRIEGVMGGGHCAPHPLPNEGSQAISLGVHWRSLASNFDDFCDFDGNFTHFFQHLPSHLTTSTCRGCGLLYLEAFLKDGFDTLPSSALYHIVHGRCLLENNIQFAQSRQGLGSPFHRSSVPQTHGAA